MRVLLVEDEDVLAALIAKGLRAEGFAVDVCHDGEQALERLPVNDYDVAVLDRDLPKVHGDEVCQYIVEAGLHVRVLMLTAAAGVEERVGGLSLGADDYLPKPFAFDELVARIRALGRRNVPALPPVLRCGDLALDPGRKEVRRGSRLVDLTPKEFGVLEELMRARGRVVSAETLLEKAWDEHADPFTTAVRVAVANLRRKLGEPDPIKTVPRAGYQLSCGAEGCS